MKFKWNLQPEFERYKKEQKMYKEDEKFEKESEEYIEEFINVKKEYTTDIKAIHVNLLDKTNEELRVW